jgi:hypothetical protein
MAEPHSSEESLIRRTNVSICQAAIEVVILFYLFFWRDTCKAGALPLEPYLQFTLLWVFLRLGLENYLPGLASNLHPPDLSLLSS